ncbi:MAG: EscU/YscU/HrcU family type III secretion system export apparatus switch protein [Myxococcota bacterium]
MSDDPTNKPHPATPKRREEFRKEGKFAKARDTTLIAVFAGVLGVVVFGHAEMGDTLFVLFKRCHGDLSAVVRGDGRSITTWLGPAVLRLAAPPALAACVFGIAAGAKEAGFRLYPELLQPKLSKLNPLPKLKDMLNPKNASFELALATFRVGVVGAVCYRRLRSDIPTLLALAGAPIGASLSLVGGLIVRMILESLLVLTILAIVDYQYNKYKLERQMRMSDQELKEEMKQADQDPKLKGKLRAKAREISRQRIIAAVGDADVVITNPTHFAVALRYGESDPAPVVIAKGIDSLALRMRAEARTQRIPIVENRALARALYDEVTMGQPIPGAHFVAVAKVLAFVFSLRGRTPRRRTGTGSPVPTA